MAGRIAEFARRPPRERAAIYAGAVALLGLLYWQFGLSPARKSVKSAEDTLAGVQAELNKVNGDKKKRDDLIAKQEELKKQIEGNQRALPSDAAMAAFLDLLERRYSEAGVTFVRSAPLSEVVLESFVKSPVEVELTGTYYQLVQFFASLRPRVDAGGAAGAAAAKDRIVTIENLTVFDPRVVNNQLLLTAKFNAATFSAAPAPASATPANQPAGAAPKPATGGAAPGVAPVTPAAAQRAADRANAATIDRANVDGEAPVGTTTGSGAGKGLDRLKGGL